MQKVLIDAKAITTTSSGFSIENKEDITFQFIATGITSGNGVFTIDGSNDGITWVTGLAFLDATATATGTFVTSKTLSSAGSSAGYFPNCGFKMIRAKVTFTTDGVYSCIVSANRKI